MRTRFFLQVALQALCVSAFATSFAGATPLITDSNLLSNLALNPANLGVSSYFNTGGAATAYGPGAADYGPQNATNASGNGPGSDFVFDSGDGDQRVAITGFNSAINELRIWSGDLRPLQVTIRSSTTSKTSINSGDYETLLVPLASLSGLWSSTGNGYISFPVAAPAGTKSLYFDFDTGQDTTGSPGFARISELQAIVPEPSSLMLFAGGVVGLLAAARRRSK